MKAIILAAGIGSRVGNQLPKCLLNLPQGDSIIASQINLLRKSGVREIIGVVGFKKEFIMEKHPDIVYKYNPFYHLTNTSKSLMLAMEGITEDDVIWLNGDVFLEIEVLKKVLSKKGNIIAVNKAICGKEEVKYRTNSHGEIKKISKKIAKAEGEALGINKITKQDFAIFLENLRACDDNDYFERAIEISIAKGMKFFPVDISDCKCIEIDFKKDFERAKEIF